MIAIPTRFRSALLAGLCCFLIYNLNGRAITAGDTYPARYLPFAILQHHTIFMNPVARVAAQGRTIVQGPERAFWMLPRADGRIMSLYPIVLPVLTAPLYVPAVAWLHVAGPSDVRFDSIAKLMEKLTASLLAALSVSLLYLLLRRRTTNANALLLTAAYAFGTTTWVVSSQALWQHGIAQVLVIIALLLTGPFSVRRAVVLALVCGLIACNRPPDVVLAGVLGLYALSWAGRRHAALLAAVAAAPMLIVLAYNIRYGGNVAGGYGVIGRAQFFDHPLLPGVAGILFSPARGLLVYSPFFIFIVAAFRFLPRTPNERRLTLALAAGVVIQILLYAKVDWRAGLSWGPRYMTDLLPLLFWMMIPVIEKLRGAARAAFIVMVAFSIAIEAIGAFCYYPSLDIAIYTIYRGPHDMDEAWQWRKASFVAAARHGMIKPYLWRMTQGAFDALESNGQRVTAPIAAGQELAATGWALIGHRSPRQVSVTIDGRGQMPVSTFTDRPDVRAALGEASASGWRVPIDTTHLDPGEHHVVALVWSSAEEEARFLAEQTFVVRGTTAVAHATPGGDDLREDAAIAAARLRDHQQPEGYWFTSFTSGTAFEKPRTEVNTFLTSLLVDLLDPIAASHGLDQNLLRARRHLTSQIEPGGLVRYHGRVNSPWIGTYGCAITPDTDDTALVWRIAPSQDTRQLAAALTTIQQYRRSDGLYRSWLAPRSEYQCLDPGSDPDPADVAIQMHLLMLLSNVRPADAHALCESLRAHLADDSIWVYYKRTPLVPMLRADDLRRAGCALQLPARPPVAGQEIWLTVARLLASEPDPIMTRAVLRELARDDFAVIRTNPPLLYHNDLTATVPRYYWSPDFGFALWLRLYDHNEHPRH